MSASRIIKILELTKLDKHNDEKESKNEDNLLLASLLKAYPEKNFFSKKTSYLLDSQELQLSHDLLRRPCESKKNEGQVRYEVLTDTALGETGEYGQVRKIDCTLALDEINANVIVKRKKPRAVKQFLKNCIYEFRQQQIHHEFKMTSLTKHIHMKTPVFVAESDEVHCAYAVMRHLPGEDLFKVIHQLYSNQPSPWASFDKRLSITLAILEALKTQVHDLNLVHQDIKPDNMLIDFSCNPPVVSIIDYAFAKTKEAPPHHFNCGTPHYAPPEIIDKSKTPDERSDIFSVSLMIGYLWGADFIDRVSVHNPIIQLILPKQKTYRFNQLFRNCSDPLVRLDHKEAIREILLKMHTYEMENRLNNVEEAIAVFKKIQSERSPAPPQPAARQKIFSPFDVY